MVDGIGVDAGRGIHCWFTSFRSRAMSGTRANLNPLSAVVRACLWLSVSAGLLQTLIWPWRNRGFSIKSVGFSTAHGDQGGSSHARDRGLASGGSRSDARVCRPVFLRAAAATLRRVSDGIDDRGAEKRVRHQSRIRRDDRPVVLESLSHCGGLGCRRLERTAP